jgi:hypothetical protein
MFTKVTYLSLTMTSTHKQLIQTLRTIYLEKNPFLRGSALLLTVSARGTQLTKETVRDHHILIPSCIVQGVPSTAAITDLLCFPI